VSSSEEATHEHAHWTIAVVDGHAFDEGFTAGAGHETPTNLALPTATGADSSSAPAAAAEAAFTDPGPGSAPRRGSVADPEERGPALSTASVGVGTSLTGTSSMMPGPIWW
jgi:hypothetical protein